MKRILPDLLCIVVFVLVSMAYFFAPIRDGLVLSGTDHSAALGSSVEMEAYRAHHDGQRTRWTNTIFSGMPTYQMAPSYPSTSLLSRLESVYRLGLPDVASYIFILLLGFYIMLRAFDFRAHLAALGAVLWAFSSYYLIIIGAGHIWKLLTLAFIPPTIGGLVLCYRGRYLWGMVVTGLFTALQILSNHVQMTYYFAFVMAFMALAFLFDAVRHRQMGVWLKGTGAVVVGGLIGLSANISNLYHTYEYSKETMRSKSELTQRTTNAADQTSGGLERSYITQWSYGVGETWTLLVPNAAGGASIPLSHSSAAMKRANPQYMSIYSQVGQYWGEQPGTAGPVYVGALVCFFFVLGLLIVKGPMKWALFAATVLSVLLSWGHNFMPFTDFFLDYVPMYDKFRTVASILVIAEFTMPLLALLALKRITDEPEYLRSKAFLGRAAVALALTAGPCLLFWLLPDVVFGPYMSSGEAAQLQPMVAAGQLPADLLANLEDMRRAMLTSDALRSLCLILVGLVALALFAFRRLHAVGLTVVLTVVCLFDLWQVDKRYMNDGMFGRPQAAQQYIPETEADREIALDTDPYFRVVNLTVSTFNDNTTSLRHKSIGGYHAAKLRRYQEVIEHHLSPELSQVGHHVYQEGNRLVVDANDSTFGVVNMLNTKYFILGQNDETGRLRTFAALNPRAMGNAWMVDHIDYVATADDEIERLGDGTLRHTAVVNNSFRDILGPEQPKSVGHVALTSYEANRLTYKASSTAGGVVVFSEIYYPGWTCTVDGKPTPIARANYLLRAVRIPAGHHDITLAFDPTTVHTTERIAYAALTLLLALVLALAGLSVYRKRKAK